MLHSYLLRSVNYICNLIQAITKNVDNACVTELHWPAWLHNSIESTSGQRCTTIVNRHGSWLNQPLWREFDMVLLTQVGGRHYLVSFYNEPFSSAIYCVFVRMSYLYIGIFESRLRSARNSYSSSRLNA